MLSQILKLDFDVAIPGSGKPVSKADLEALKTMIDGIVAHAAALVKAGVPKDRLMAQLKAENLPWEPNFSGPDLEHFYMELRSSQ